MSFIIYDVVFLVLFALFVGIFLYTGRKNLKKEGLLLLYKTQWGTKLINNIGKKYKKTLGFLSYVSIGTGYLLMALMVYMFGKLVWIYAAYPAIVRAVKVPPIMPLVPYIDKLVPGMPPLYAFYFLAILVVIAIPHEMAHGIFMRRYGVKIKSTGFGFFPFFLPVFLAAFVEQDEKSFTRSSKFEQMAILSAGTFANILTAIIGVLVMWLFFSLAFAPAGITFDSYAMASINTSSITQVNGIDVNDLTYQGLVDLSDKDLNSIVTNNASYLVDKNLLVNSANQKLFEENDSLAVYYDAPAIRSGLSGVILSINDIEIDSLERLNSELEKYSVGDQISLKVYDEDIYDLDLTLDKHPNKDSVWLGIGFVDSSRSGIMGSVMNVMSSFEEPNVYYESQIGDLGDFIKNLLWWIVMASFSVALVNMLPVGIFDGGRFFYLTVLGITRNEKFAERSFRFVTWLFLFLVLALMVFWALSFS